MTQAGFEPAIAASERPQAHSLEGAAKAIGQLGSRHRLYQVGCQTLRGRHDHSKSITRNSHGFG
jgi:ribosomal protein S28E/S33